MKKIRFYGITEQEFNNTEYRPADIEVDEIVMGENDWTIADVLENEGGIETEEITKTADGLTVYRVKEYGAFDGEEIVTYVVEITEQEDNRNE